MSDNCTHANPSEGQYPHHDWRLWKRDMHYRDDGTLGWPQDGWTEQWYCTRCRTFEERTVLLEEDA
jgi:hypothetical protein